jgi:sugar lactone lactonase YvrE
MKKILSIVISFILLPSMVSFTQASSQSSPQIAVNDDRLVFVSGIGTRNILVISPYGQLIKKLPLPPSIQQVDYLSACPCGGYLLISDTRSGTAITLDDRTGNQLFHFSGVAYPGAVSISKHRSRYMAIVDQKKNAIQIFTERGAFVREIPGRLRFREANQIVLDKDNFLWVLDSSSSKIFRFDIQGNLMLTIQSNRSLSLQNLKNIDTDEQGQLHVLDGSGKILVFSAQGNVLESKDLGKHLSSQAYHFTIENSNPGYHILADNNQYYHLLGNLAIENKIQNLSLEEIKKVISLRIGSRILVQVGFDMTLIEEAPFIDATTNRSMVPIRAIAEIFGAVVLWNAAKREVTLQWNQQTIRLIVNSDIAWINGVQHQMDARPVIRRDRTFVPLRFISEAFGAHIQWYATDKKIVISQ